jgi:xylulokinase
VAAALGLPPDVQVVAGAIDNTAAAIGAGAVADYVPHLHIGTSSWMAAHVPYKKTDSLASLASVPRAVPGRYLLTALQATAGGNLTFLRDNILYHKDELLQEVGVPDIFKVLDQIAGRTPAGANGVLYTPWIWGERAPVDDHTLRAGLYNLSLHNTRGAAWIGAVGLGEISFGDVPGLVAFNRMYDPNPAHRTVYNERFAVFQQVYGQMKGVYRRMNGG